jgi:AhpD family alkylhydroperoxidase
MGRVNEKNERTETMDARIKNPAVVLPGALDAFQELGKVVAGSAVPEKTLALIQLRASQINGCAVCLDIHSRELQHLGASSEQMHTVAAFREAPYFSDAERAALALTEAVTRVADSADPVPDEVWDEAARHYSESELAAIVVAIAVINAYNRVNRATAQPAGPWTQQIVDRELATA